MPVVQCPCVLLQSRRRRRTGKMNDADYINLDEPGELSAEPRVLLYARFSVVWLLASVSPCATRRCCTAVWQPSSIKCVNEGAYAGAFVD